MGNEFEKEYMYIYIHHFAVNLKLTQHCTSIIHKYKIKNF